MGPVVNGVATDILTVLMADNTFGDVADYRGDLHDRRRHDAVDIATGVDRVVPGS